MNSGPIILIILLLMVFLLGRASVIEKIVDGKIECQLSINPVTMEMME